MTDSSPTTFEEYKAKRDAAKMVIANSKFSFLSGVRLVIPHSAHQLREQFFELRYDGVSRKTIEHALEEAYGKG